MVAGADRNWGAWTLGLIVALTGIRVVLLAFSPLQLHGDEAQYFAWSRELAAGYFSKPPLIAWVIRASTEVFGTGEWAIRMWSPVAHGLAAGFLFGAGQKLLDARTGFWASLAYLTLPGIVASSAIASTDALLLMCVALFLWAWAEVREAQCKVRWVYALGLAAGLGLMSKYAMAFILIGFVGVLLTDARTRSRVNLPRTLVVGTIVAAIILPNIRWNLANDFATAGHTVANANLQAELLNPLEGLEFAFSQFAVAGALLPLIIWATVKGWAQAETRALAILTLTPLLIILAQAFLSRANANWAASAYAPGALLVTAVWLRETRWGGLRAGVGVNAILAAALSLVTLSPALTDTLGLANSVKRVRGWDETVFELRQRARTHDVGTIATDNRITFYALQYYDRHIPRALTEEFAPKPLAMWQMEATPHNHAELTEPLLEGAEEPILFVNYHREHLEKVRRDFARFEALEPVEVPLGGGKVRHLNLYLAEGYVRAEPRLGPSD